MQINSFTLVLTFFFKYFLINFQYIVLNKNENIHSDTKYEKFLTEVSTTFPIRVTKIISTTVVITHQYTITDHSESWVKNFRTYRNQHRDKSLPGDLSCSK